MVLLRRDFLRSESVVRMARIRAMAASSISFGASVAETLAVAGACGYLERDGERSASREFGTVDKCLY